MTQKPRDLATVKPVDLIVDGVPVRVYCDRDGRPVSASAGFWEGPDGERERSVRIALQWVTERAERAAEAQKRARDRTAATAQSRRVRAVAVADHPTTQWLARAYAANPNLGRKTLAHAARRLALAAEAPERTEITEDRARRFLERQHAAPLPVKGRG